MPKSYVAIASAPGRRFEITGGLRRGYEPSGETIPQTLDDVKEGHHAWQREMGLILGVLITPATISYGWPDGDGIRCDTEPGFVLSGTYNPLYHSSVSNDDADLQIGSLASFLAEWLAQTRIYYTFRGWMRILEVESPT